MPLNAPIRLSLPKVRLTVRLLVASAGTATTELLRLTAARIGDEQAAIVLNQRLLDLPLSLLVNVLLVVRYNSLCNCLPNGCTKNSD